MNAADDPRTCKGLLASVLFAQSHQCGHFSLGKYDFFAAELSKFDVSYFVIHSSSYLDVLRCF